METLTYNEKRSGLGNRGLDGLARGKSGLPRAGCQLTAGRGDPTDQCHRKENSRRAFHPKVNNVARKAETVR